jgi:hypothetical protein
MDGATHESEVHGGMRPAWAASNHDGSSDWLVQKSPEFLTDRGQPSISCPSQFAKCSPVLEMTSALLRPVDRKGVTNPTKGDTPWHTPPRQRTRKTPRPPSSSPGMSNRKAPSRSETRSVQPGDTRTATATPSSLRLSRSTVASFCASRSKTQQPPQSKRWAHERPPHHSDELARHRHPSGFLSVPLVRPVRPCGSQIDRSQPATHYGNRLPVSLHSKW